jgi:hypothetical protein
MKPEQQRIAIAEACGWVIPIGCTNHRTMPCGTRVFFNNLKDDDPIPDYLHDLNAMHQAENFLSSINIHDYWLHLLAMNEYVPALGGTASASVRAEAFLRTIGKWENDK